ncbi:M48 family metallopeptidase [Luedemannella helvata]|uniref:M48 family metallopeptidase n=1 Tax=Luedemannella helvata TaxID=349315 RepID=A0ABN2L2I6_9ACTN
MNFFERQQRVRRMSVRLVALFVLAVIAIVVAVDLAVLIAFNAFSSGLGNVVGIVIVTSLITLTAISLAAAFRMLGLRGGGGKVARELGGVAVPPDTTDPQLRRLRNVVEEIAIASGTPVPEVYVLPQEDGINAFAAGWDSSSAAVAVTRGTLERLNRDELQGVIAHEFSHVVNGDMRLNIRLMGLLYGILFLAVIGRTLTQFGIIGGGRRDEKSSGNPLAVIGIALLVTGGVGVLAGRLIKASVSRQREYLADASAVQFTRQPSGIAGALKKIAGLEAGSNLKNPRREEVGHMLFGAGAGAFASWFATHPPLVDRIKVLDPSFDANQLTGLRRQWATHPPSGLEEDLSLGLIERNGAAARRDAAAPAARPTLPEPSATVPVPEATLVGSVGAPGAQSYAQAGAILDEIPADVLERAHSPATVVPLLLGLLMADEPAARDNQRAALAAHGPAVADAAAGEAAALARLHPLLRLPLAEVALPALRALPASDKQAALRQVFDLIHADGRISGYEYCLSRLVYRELDASLNPRSAWRGDRRTIAGSRDAVALLYAVLAQYGNPEEARAGVAFQAGMARVLPRVSLRYVPPPQGVVALESAWPSLIGLTPEDKRELVAGALAVISADGVTTLTELELLRTVCALLECPVPLELAAPVPRG